MTITLREQIGAIEQLVLSYDAIPDEIRLGRGLRGILPYRDMRKKRAAVMRAVLETLQRLEAQDT